MRRLLSCLFLCLVPLLADAVEAPRPKIGLVLSGGAARGLAHIGVLKALEEQGIHIDAIAGTSMGAVIGGLYASGYKIDELEKLALGIDWQQALSDAPPREDVPFRRKQDDRDFLVKQKLSFRDDGSLGLPLGVIQGQNLALLLESMFAHSSNTRNFDKLPIPFRAVATDITTGEKVVFSKGHLPQVIRASMSIPAVFAPVELDGRLLVDGGMTDNIPLDVAREMGVDIAIVVDIGTPLRSRKQLATVVDVLNQSITLMTRRNSEEQLKALAPKDVLIQPPLAAYGVTDFGRAKDMIDAGYRATRALDVRLAHLRPAEPIDADLIAARTPGERTPVITAIQVENDSKVSDDVIRYYIRQGLGEPLNLGRLQSGHGHPVRLGLLRAGAIPRGKKRPGQHPGDQCTRQAQRHRLPAPGLEPLGRHARRQRLQPRRQLPRERHQPPRRRMAHTGADWRSAGTLQRVLPTHGHRLTLLCGPLHQGRGGRTSS